MPHTLLRCLLYTSRRLVQTICEYPIRHRVLAPTSDTFNSQLQLSWIRATIRGTFWNIHKWSWKSVDPFFLTCPISKLVYNDNKWKSIWSNLNYHGTLCHIPEQCMVGNRKKVPLCHEHFGCKVKLWWCAKRWNCLCQHPCLKYNTCMLRKGQLHPANRASTLHPKWLQHEVSIAEI